MIKLSRELGMQIPELEGKMSSRELSEQIAYDRVMTALKAQQEQLSKQQGKTARSMGRK